MIYKQMIRLLMDEKKAEILKLLDGSILLSEKNRSIIADETRSSEDEDQISQMLSILRSEKDCILDFLKEHLSEKDIPIIDLKRQMTDNFLSKMRIKEKAERSSENGKADLLLTQLA